MELNINKMTKAELKDRIAVLEAALVEDRTCLETANRLLQEEVVMWQSKVMAQDPPKTTESHTNNRRQEDKELVEGAIQVEAGKVFSCMMWAVQKVDFRYALSSDFLQGFKVEVNKDQGWMRMRPNKETASSTAFAKDFLAACRAKNMKANYWRNTGVFFYY